MCAAAHFIEQTRKRLAAEGDDGASPITQIARTFRSLADSSDTLELLCRHETRFSRENQRALAFIGPMPPDVAEPMSE